MGRQTTFQNFLTSQNFEIPVSDFLINLFLAAILSFVLSVIYVKYGKSLSNRRLFARNFILMAVTTTLIITIVKSSLALSLGLVGALSIVRFRAAIKEPEELSYLFLTIAIGLGFGADQRMITLVAFTVIVGVILVYSRLQKSYDNQNLNLTITSKKTKNVSLEKITHLLTNNCSAVNLKRFDESSDLVEATFLIEFDNFKQLNKAKSALQRLGKSVKITFLDNKGIF